MNIVNDPKRLETMRVRDIMIPLDKYPSLKTTATLRDAIKLMESFQIEFGGRSSLPRAILIFDYDGSFCGCIRRRDILRGLEPKFLVSEPIRYRMKLFDINLDPNLFEMANRHVARGMTEQAFRPVTDVMRPIEARLSPDDHIMKAAYEMVVYGLNLIPVMERKKQVIGVVRSVEILSEISKLVL